MWTRRGRRVFSNARCVPVRGPWWVAAPKRGENRRDRSDVVCTDDDDRGGDVAARSVSPADAVVGGRRPGGAATAAANHDRLC